MVSWGILEQVTARGASGKPAFVLAAEWEEVLDEAIDRAASASLFGQSFMVLAQPGLEEAAKALAREHADDLAWVGILGQREGLLVGLGQAGGATPARIERSLRAAGVECELRPVGDTASGDEVAPFLRGFGLGGSA